MTHSTAPRSGWCTPDSLSEPTRWVWAKSGVDEVGRLTGWLPLHQHLADTAGIMRKLWVEYLPASTRRRIAQGFGTDTAFAGRVATWLAGAHDVGKASHAFAVKVPALSEQMRQHGFDFSGSLDPQAQSVARHEAVGHLAMVERLTGVHGLAASTANGLGSVIAAHHGRPSDQVRLRAIQLDRTARGRGPQWAQSCTELLELAETMAFEPGDLDRLRKATPDRAALMLLSALVILADWIASSDLFPLVPLDEAPAESTEIRVERAWSELRLPSPWRPKAPTGDPDDLFRARFTLRGGATPNPLQRAEIDLARTMPEPALIVVESEMGSGKTELAFAIAEILAERFELGGCFIGLPTQATSDGMFARLLTWAKRLGDETPNSVFLAHGRAFLQPDHQALERARRRRHAHGTSEDAATDRVVLHEFFDRPKTGPLANFVVGTIDQQLTAALKTRHVMLRHLALANKVVVIDEVHAHTAYTDEYIKRTLHWLGAYGVPVILLSATLPEGKREAFLAAYESGRGTARGTTPQAAALDAYPRITVSAGTEPRRTLLPDPTGRQRSVEFAHLDDVELVPMLTDALRDGGCAVVIRNTVGRVQETARRLAEQFDETELIVAHARFPSAVRAENDQRLLSEFGPGGGAELLPRPWAVEGAPVRRVVIASQVIEQSLDVDFDVMVSDFAPIDLLLQRSGRLHRHPRRSDERPASARLPRLYLTGVDWTSTPPEPDRAWSTVYDASIQYRSLAALDGLTAVEVPADIPRLVRRTYSGEPIGPESWQESLAAAESKRLEQAEKSVGLARDFLLERVGAVPSHLLGLIQGEDRDSATGGSAGVRDGAESLEVILLELGADGALHTFGPNRLALPFDAKPNGHEITAILGSSIRLPVGMVQGRTDELIRRLEAAHPADLLAHWSSVRRLAGELVLVVDEAGDPIATGLARTGYRLHYDHRLGLEHDRVA